MPYRIDEVGGAPNLRAALLALNNAHARETSLLDAAELDRMLAAARIAVVVEAGAAFLLVFDQHSDYHATNFLWFRERFDRFLYIDRVIVAESHRRLGLGRLLYEDLFARAAALGHSRIACEVNSRPPNPVSDAFHASLGFTEVGTGVLNGGDRRVRYLLRDLASPGSA